MCGRAPATATCEFAFNSGGAGTVQRGDCDCVATGEHAPAALALPRILAPTTSGKHNSRVRYSYPFVSKQLVANILTLP
jgi:hypothetical protein